MDTSKEYIKMCEKAVEIQKLTPIDWNDRNGSYYVTSYKPNRVYMAMNAGNGKSRGIWLPRQDQLQEMVTSKNSWVDYFVDSFACFVEREYGKGSKTLNDISMEQLWLAFVMKELYQKTWNGTNWV